MKNILTILILFIGFVSFSQSNLTIFNNGGQQFYVILNGIKQNSKPMTNVVVSGIKNGSYSVKLIFADGKTPDIDKNFFLEEPSDITTRVIFKKGKGKLQLIGMEPTKGVATEQGTIIYRPDNSTTFSDAPVVQETVIPQNTGNSGTQTQTVTQTTTITDQTNPSNNGGLIISINVNDPTNGGQNMNMSVNMSGMGTQTTNTTTQTTQTTTVTQTVTDQTTSNNNSIVCKNILGDGDKFVTELKALMMDDDRMAKINKDLKDFCLTASQAYKIVETVSFEEDRLEIAKYLYDRIIDKDKAGVIFPLFNYDSSKIEFREYMNKKK